MELSSEKKKNFETKSSERDNLKLIFSKKHLQVPEYGKSHTGSTTVIGVHYSKFERKNLSGLHYGKGMRGAERVRLLRNSANKQQNYRVHYYVNEGNDITPESGVGNYAHVTKLNNLYNWKDDPLHLWDEARKQFKDSADLVNYVENAIVTHGFDGVYAPKALGKQGVVVLLGEKHINVPVLSAGINFRCNNLESQI